MGSSGAPPCVIPEASSLQWYECLSTMMKVLFQSNHLYHHHITGIVRTNDSK